MTYFPSSVLPPSSVKEARAKRKSHLIKTICFGMGIRSFIIVCELIGVIMVASQALLLDALFSLIDVVCSLFLLLFIILAEKPPDEEHPFGHGKYEPLAGLQMGLLSIIVGLGMLIQQATQLTTTTDQIMSPRAWIIPFLACISLEISYAVTRHIAKKYQSTALIADAFHYRIDSLTSLLATGALMVAAYIPEWSHFIDHLGAMLISSFMLGMGIYVAKENLNQLMDRSPESRYFGLVRSAAMNVEGVKGTEKLLIRFYGPDAHINIDIEVDPELSVEEAHRISQYVRAKIQGEWPAVRDVTVHIEPYFSGDHVLK